MRQNAAQSTRRNVINVINERDAGLHYMHLTQVVGSVPTVQY